MRVCMLVRMVHDEEGKGAILDKTMITEDKASEEHKKRRVKARESRGESQSKSKSRAHHLLSDDHVVALYLYLFVVPASPLLHRPEAHLVAHVHRPDSIPQTRRVPLPLALPA